MTDICDVPSQSGISKPTPENRSTAKCYFRLPELITSDLNILRECGHPLEKNLPQSPRFERPHNVLDGL
jgi:hypothetical protein